MRTSRVSISVWSVLLWAFAVASFPGEPGTLSFEERVRAQEAVERVYYAHRIWPKDNPGHKPPFEEVVPRAVLEAKVTDYLKKCQALEKRWQRPIQPAEVQAEVERMAAQSKDPSVLREIFAALDNDPTLVAECLARPTLAERTIRILYANDSALHAEARKEAERALEEASPESLCALPGGERHRVTYRLRGPRDPEGVEWSEPDVVYLGASEFEKASAREAEPGRLALEESREAFAVKTTVRKAADTLVVDSLAFRKRPFEAWWQVASAGARGVEPFAGGANYALPEIARSPSPESAADSWLPGNLVAPGSPSTITGYSVIWTGAEMIVWGGYTTGNSSSATNTGCSYNPATEVWTPTPTGTNCPSARGGQTAVWTGTEMIVWGGFSGGSYVNTGGRLNPATGVWAATSTSSAPAGRSGHKAVWTGYSMIVWGGGSGSGLLNTGGGYSAMSNYWAPTPTTGACPSARSGFTMVWTGSEVVVWGGGTAWNDVLNTGARLIASTNTWTATPTDANCPTARWGHTAVWTGAEMVVWGGSSSNVRMNTGGRLTPSTGTWLATPTGTGCPEARDSHSAIWTGTDMILWGGSSGYYLNTGARLTLATGEWTATSTGANCPVGRRGHAALWTGTLMILWGGDTSGGPLGETTGARYVPYECSSPTAPVLDAVADADPCDLTGVTITFTPGAGAVSHNLIVDGADVATGIASPHTYRPNDTASHVYVVRATSSCGPADSAPQSCAEEAVYSPGTVTVTDLDPCAPTGVSVAWAEVPDSFGYDLQVDGTTVVSSVTSPYLYVPGDTQVHGYRVRGHYSSGDCRWSTATLGTDASVPAPVISGPVSVCAGASAQLDAGPGYASYLWSPDNQTTRTIAVSPTTAITYSVAVTDTNGCQGTSAGHTVTPLTDPPPAPVITGPDSACAGSSVTLDAGGGYSAYFWSPGGQTTQTILTRLNSTTAFTVTVTEANGCQATSDPFTVTALGNAVPVISSSVSSSPSDTCSPEFHVANGTVLAAAESNGTLYIGGSFTYVGPNAGSAFGLDSISGIRDSAFPVVNGPVYAAAPDGAGGWFIGGAFSGVEGSARNRLAHILPDRSLDPAWDPGADGDVKALAVSGGTVYAAGVFSAVGGQARSRIAAIDGATGAPLAWNPGVTGTEVSALTLGTNTVYLGGNFTAVGGQSRTNLAAVDRTSGLLKPWSALPNGTITAMATDGTVVYISGTFTAFDVPVGPMRPHYAALDAVTGAVTSWVSSSGASAAVLVLSGTTLYAGGSFTSLGGQTRNNVGAVSTVTGLATAWNPNANGAVYSLAVSGSAVYAGGAFTSIGGQNRNYLAALDAATGLATAWNPNIVGGGVRALAPWGSTVFAGGDFWSAGSTMRAGIAALDTSTGEVTAWNPGSGGGIVNALAVAAGTVYVGGSFANMGGQARNNIAAVDAGTGEATAWNPNANGAVSALALSGGILYAGGSFTSVGGQSRNRIAALDVSSGAATGWDPNANGNVLALAESGSTVYAGGGFGTIGGQTRNGIAALDASTGAATPWNPQASGWVYALAAYGSTVYAGGSFTSIGGQYRQYIAALDTFSGIARPFSASAAGGYVYSLAVSGPTVYAGGTFTTVGGQPRNRLAALDATTGAAAQWNPNAGGQVRALALTSSSIYAGGAFTTMGGQGRTSLAAFPTNRSSVCTGTPVTLTSSLAMHYQWKKDGIDIGGATSWQLVLSSPSESGTYTVDVTYDNGCENSSGARVVTINPTPSPSITGPSAFCDGVPVVLDAGAGYASYLWSPGDQTTQTVTVSPSTTTSYAVRVTTSAGCSATSAPHLVSVPYCGISGPDPVCATGSIFFTAPSGMAAYAWTASGMGSIAGPADGQSVEVTAGALPQGMPSGPYSLDASALFLCHLENTTEDERGLYGSGSGSFGVGKYGQGLLVGDVAYNSPTGLDLNQGSVEFWAKAGWSSADTTVRPIVSLGNNGNGIFIRKDSANNLVLLEQSSNVDYTLQYDISSWTTSDWHHVAATWQGSVLMLFVDGVLRAESPTAAHPTVLGLVRLGGTSANVWLDEVRISNVPRLGASAPFSLTVGLAVTDRDGCGKTCSKTVALAGLPAPQVAGPSLVCSGASVTLDAGPGYASYFWSPGGQTAQSITVSPSETTTYAVTVADAAGCQGTSPGHVVTVSAHPDPVIAGGPTSLCAYEAAQLDAGSGYSSYLWSPGGQQTQTITVYPSATTVYSVTVMNEGGCTGTSPDFEIAVLDNPIPPIYSSVASSPSSAAAKDFWVTDGEVRAVVEHEGVVYVGGSFSRAMPYTGSGVGIDLASGTWVDSFPKVNGPVYAVAPDGGGGWFIGGAFTQVGSFARSGLAHVMPGGSVDSTWDPAPDGSVSALAVSGATVYVGGEFTTVGGQGRDNLAALDAATGAAAGWNPGADGPVAALAVSGSVVYAGGYFTSAGGQYRNFITALDAATGAATLWNPGAVGPVLALTLSGSTLYAGGLFTTIAGQPRNYMAALDAVTGMATSWNPNANGPVYALAVSGSTVYAGGDFTSIWSQVRNRAAAMNNTTGATLAWNPAPNGTVRALAVPGSVVYMGGAFTSVGGQSRRNLAALDAATGAVGSWAPEANGTVATLAVDGSTVYAGGELSSIGGQVRGNLAAFDASTGAVTAWNPAADGAVNALAADGSTIYAGGSFSGVGGLNRSNVAALDAATGAATSWNPGAGGVVRALLVLGAKVYAGGDFTSAGGQVRNRAAAFDIASGAVTEWNPNADAPVSALATSGPAVYAGGSFTSIGGQPRDRIAALGLLKGLATPWNPSSNGAVSTLAVSGSRVFAGGAFTAIGGQSRNHIAALDVATGAATPWNPDASHDVHSLAVSDAAVLAGGQFVTIGGQGRARLAALNPATGAASPWDPAPNGYVNAVALSDGSAYAGGSFTSIGGQNRAHLAAFALDWTSTCPGASVTLTTLFANGHQWFRDGVAIPGATERTLNLGSPVQVGSYTVRTTALSGCKNLSAPHLVTTDAPTPVPAVSGPAAVCAGGSVTLDAGAGYTSYLWSPGGETTQSITVSPAATTDYTVTVAEANGCQGTSAVWTVTVNALPLPSITGESSNACPAITATFATEPGMSDYQWFLDGNPISDATSYGFTADLSGAYTVRYTDPAGCIGYSNPHDVAISFCAQTEVSPQGGPFPARLVADSGTHYLYFQKTPLAAGYNIYEGDLGSPWYSHGGPPDFACDAAVEDLGTGEMRAAITPSGGDHYYLVAAFGSGVEGPSGYDSSGAEIPRAQSTCPP